LMTYAINRYNTAIRSVKWWMDYLKVLTFQLRVWQLRDLDWM
jgi:hypothetical protein